MNWKERIVSGAILGVILLGIFVYFGCHISRPEEGEHIGYITEVGYRGLLWKTHYVKLVDSRFSVGQEGYSSYWYYGVDESNPWLWERAKKWKDENKPLTVSYRCDFIVPKWERSEGCIITDIIQNANL